MKLPEIEDFYDALYSELIDLKVNIQDRERKLDDNYKYYALGLTAEETAKLILKELDEERIQAWKAEEEANSIGWSDENDYQEWRKS